jgi:hypothetical protein
VVRLARTGPHDALGIDGDSAHRLGQLVVPRGGEGRAAVAGPPQATGTGGDVDDVLGGRVGGDVADAATDVARAQTLPDLVRARRLHRHVAHLLGLRQRCLDGGVREGAVRVGALLVHPLLGAHRVGGRERLHGRRHTAAVGPRRRDDAAAHQSGHSRHGDQRNKGFPAYGHACLQDYRGAPRATMRGHGNTGQSTFHWLTTLAIRAGTLQLAP